MSGLREEVLKIESHRFFCHFSGEGIPVEATYDGGRNGVDWSVDWLRNLMIGRLVGMKLYSTYCLICR